MAGIKSESVADIIPESVADFPRNTQLGHLASGRFPHERCAMDDQANVVGARPGAAERPPESGAAALGRGGRMSRQRKTAAVLRLLRGEDLETVSRELGVTAATLTGWHDAFLAAGEVALATRPGSGEELESDRLKARLGAALIERDLLHEKIAILEADRPFARRRRKP
jgi:transposase